VGITDMAAILDCSRETIERKLRDPDSDFPMPFTIRRKRYWRRADIRAWIAAKAIIAAPRSPWAPIRGWSPGDVRNTPVRLYQPGLLEPSWINLPICLLYR